MMTSHKLTQTFIALAALALLSMSALAADPGLVPGPASGVVSDQKAGSVLVYNLYSSNSTNPAAENTRINITNTDDANGVFVHLFFVDGRTCSVADTVVCLSRSQTTSITASDLDPDVTGFIIAVATGADGLPICFNQLIGDEYVKLTSGHQANLGAEAISWINGPNPIDLTWFETSILRFDGVAYDALPRVLAIDNLLSARDGNNTLLVVNRIHIRLNIGGESVGDIFGLLFNELEAAFSFSFFHFPCQLKTSLSDTFPRTTPRLSSVIPSGSTGWMKFWRTDDRALLGSVINRNTSAAATAYQGGHNLHKLTYTTNDSIVIPVFSPTCN
ncbi:MAG TPA: hypothetical protein VFD58_10960 [Blastocatellia bacterium]|nr:hypothetical protein [Blastocatellia bacterium]